MTRFLFVVLGVFLWSTGALAQSPSEFRDYESDSIQYSSQKVPPGRFQVLSGQFYPNWQPHFGKGLFPLPKYYQWKQRLSSKGFDYLVIISPEFQIGSKGGKVHANSEQDFIWQWRVVENENAYSKFLFWGLNIYRFTDVTPSEMSNAQGLTVETIGGADARSFWMLGTFFFEQALLRQRLKLRIGHLFTNLFYATNKYMIDDRDTFINGLLNAPSGVQWTSQKSLGMMVQYDTDKFYGIVGFQDQKSDPRYPSFSSFAEGKFVYLAEVGFTPNTSSINASGKYSLTFSYNTKDTSGPAGYGLVLNAQQDVSEQVGIYGRYGQSFDRFTDWKNTFAVGIAYNQPFGWHYDQISLAYLQGNPSNTNLSKDDKGFNFYWKWLLTYRMDFTLDAQYYFERSKAAETDSDNVFLIAGRLRVIF